VDARAADIALMRALVAVEVAESSDGPSTSGWLQRLCRVASRELPASGVGVSLLAEDGNLMTAAASSTASAQMEELQFTVGEGPCRLAFESRRPVLVPDLVGSGPALWPGYAPAAHDHGVRAVFAFPLQVGVARLGVLDVYRTNEGALSPPALTRALTFTELALEGLLNAGATPDAAEALLEDAPGTSYEVYQAQGMVTVQLGVGATEALTRLRAYAFAHGRRLTDVAKDVLERRLVMERDDP
jgi:hypothetical protein